MNINLLFFVTLIILVTLAILYYNLLKEHRKLKKFAGVFTMRDWHKKGELRMNTTSFLRWVSKRLMKGLRKLKMRKEIKLKLSQL